MFKKHKKIVGLALALMLMTSGCGSTPTEVTDYGQTSESVTSEGEDGKRRRRKALAKA